MIFEQEHGAFGWPFYKEPIEKSEERVFSMNVMDERGVPFNTALQPLGVL